MQRFERKQGAPGVVLEIWLRPRLGVTRTGTGVHSAATPVAGFSALCRLRIAHTSLDRRSIPRSQRWCDGSHGRRGGVVFGQHPGNAPL